MSDSIANPSELGPNDLDDPLDVIVAQCLDSSEGDLRGAVDTACRANPEHASEIRRRVAALRAAGLLRHEPPSDDEPFPERLGDFRLLRRLGGGGMGVVFRARQESLGREVALKLIRPEHMYFPRARERFRRETEAVARLQHPGIVPIYTVGEEHGVPYFAMELVAGCTLGEVVKVLEGRAPESLRGRDFRDALLRSSPIAPDANEVKSAPIFEGTWIEACLAIVLQVARALHHAHGRGVLHRDIKPSNIALTFDGRALLLDFGLASLEAGARVTQQGSALGSLLYMSPEQIRGDSAHVDERSDVYALGVTLYELLTLQAPYYDTNPVGTRQAILEGRADSIRVRNRAVPKDLETVCFKAMEREPVRRYRNAEALARDLTNVLELRPIDARPPSATVRVRRWVQRNRAKSVALALGGLLVVVTPSALLWQQHRHGLDLRKERDAAIAAKKDADEQRAAAVDANAQAQKERDAALAAKKDADEQRLVADAANEQAQKERVRAQLEADESQSVAEFMVDLFGAADPANSFGRELTARELLELGEKRLDRDLADQPELRARLMQRIGDSYTSLGLYDKARPLLEHALELRRERFGDESLEVAQSCYGLALLHDLVGDKRALEIAQRAVALQRKLSPERDATLARYIVGEANCLGRAGKYDEAIALFDEALAIRDTLKGDQRKLSELILSNEAHALYLARRYQRAVDAAREAIQIQRELFDGPHPGLLASLNTLALSLKSLRQFDEARVAYDEVLTLGERLYGTESDRYAIFTMNEASFLEDLGEIERARQLFERSLAVFDVAVARDFPQRVTCLVNLAGLCLRSGQFARSRELYVEALPMVRAAYGDTSSRTLYTMHNLALCHEALGDEPSAEELLRDALESARNATRVEPMRVARELAVLGVLLVRRGELEEARPMLDEAVSIALGDDDGAGIASIAKLGQARIVAADRDPAAAEQQLSELAANDVGSKDGEWVPAAARCELAGALTASAATRDGLDLAMKSTDQLADLLGAQHPETRRALQRALAIAQALGDEELVAKLRSKLEAR